MPRMDCRIQPGVSTWFQPREPSTHGDAPQRGARTSITTTYKDDVISYVAIARPCFGAHHFSPPKIECHSCSPPNSDRRCMPTKFVLRSDMCRIDSGELPGDFLHLFYEIRSDRKSVDIGDYFLERCGYRIYYLEEISMTRLLRSVTLLILALTVRLVSAATGSADFAGLVYIGGGRKMYLECRGTGSPTVVLVSGLRGSAEDWNIAEKPSPTVFAEVAKFTRVCAYDRPGTLVWEKPSRSDPVRQPTTAGD